MSEPIKDTPSPAAADPSRADPAQRIALAPRQTPASADRTPPRPSSAGGDPSELSQQLATVLLQALGNQAAGSPEATVERSLIAREEKRFRPASADAAASIASAAGEPELAAPVKLIERTRRRGDEARAAESSAPGELQQAGLDAERGLFGRPDRAPRAPVPPIRVVWRQLSPNARSAILAAFVVLTAALAFGLGWATAPEGRNPPPAAAVAGPPGSAPARPADGATAYLADRATLDLVDEAALAQTSLNFPRAELLLLQLAQERPDLRGTQTTLAYLKTQLGNFQAAEYHISLGMAAGDDPGRLYSLRALLLARQNRSGRANDAFELATRAAPYEWRYHFLWAEYLRRTGKFQQALDELDRGIARIHEPADEELMQFKRRLTLVALDRGAELDAEISRRSWGPLPDPDWLLVGMAREGQRGSFGEAARYLRRAIELTGGSALAERLSDFFLYQWCFEKELEPLFRPLQPSLQGAGATRAPATLRSGAEGEEPAASPSAKP